MDDQSAGRRAKEDNGEPAKSEPIFNLPGILVLTLAILVAIYAIQTLVLSDQAVEWLLVTFGFIPARYTIPLSGQGLEWLWSPVTYSLLHGSIEHILFNGLWLMAFGAPVIRRVGTMRYLMFWILSSIASAALHAALNWGDPTLLIGASGVISGLMGAACRFAFPANARPRRPAHLNPRLSIAETFRSRTVIVFTLFWLFGNALIAVGVPLIGDGSQAIAWDAHIGGFVFGFFLFPLFDRALPPSDEREDEPSVLQS